MAKKQLSARVHHIAFVQAREYAKDGYFLVDYNCSEEQGSTWYNLVHKNGNRINVTATEYDNTVTVFLNGKVNKQVKLKK